MYSPESLHRSDSNKYMLTACLYLGVALITHVRYMRGGGSGGLKLALRDPNPRPQLPRFYFGSDSKHSFQDFLGVCVKIIQFWLCHC